MLPPRDLTTKIRFLLDELLPPIVRDSKWFMFLPLKLVLKNNASFFMHFKDKAWQLSAREYQEKYESINAQETRKTDLNSACVGEIHKTISGETVLEVGSGKGYLAAELARKYKVTATDLVVDEQLKEAYPNITFISANVEKLPFADKSFDTVICTHTLEHVPNIFQAVSELRRVTKNRLMIVVPKQRPYRYTFDLHVHFFPYAFSLLALMNSGKPHTGYCQEIDGDWFYCEDL